MRLLLVKQRGTSPLNLARRYASVCKLPILLFPNLADPCEFRNRYADFGSLQIPYALSLQSEALSQSVPNFFKIIFRFPPVFFFRNFIFTKNAQIKNTNVIFVSPSLKGCLSGSTQSPLQLTALTGRQLRLPVAHRRPERPHTGLFQCYSDQGDC